MDFLLLAVALCLLMLAGFGLSLLLLPKQSLGATELFALSLLFGSAVVSSALFVSGFLISGANLRWAVAALCVSLGVAGWRRAGRIADVPSAIGGWMAWTFRPRFKSGWWLLALNTAQVAVIIWLSFVRVLGWDGLLNFESKARVAFLNGGVIPLELFSDPSRTWTHQSYPLLLPLTETWLYLWIGRPDQELVKILFPLFFAAALCLVLAGNRRLGISGGRVFIAPVLVFTAPLLLIGDGSASSGYADFPLAVFYLAAVIWLMEFWRRGDFAALRLAGALLAGACWLKQEGLILWLCLMALMAIRLVVDRSAWRNWRQLLIAALPGLVVIATWRGFVRLMNPPGGDEFLPISLNTLQANLWRLPGIIRAVLNELANWRHWGMFWIAISLATAWLILSALRQKRSEPAGLVLAVLMPIALYSGVYVFSIWPDFIGHLESSFPRLLIHIALVASLLPGGALGQESSTGVTGK